MQKIVAIVAYYIYLTKQGVYLFIHADFSFSGLWRIIRLRVKLQEL